MPLEGAVLRDGLLDRTNTARTAGRPTPERTRRATDATSKVHSRDEHVFADQNMRIGLFVRSIRIARATAKIGLVALV